MKVVDLRELALKKVKITGNVIGKFGSFEIEQKYQNNTKEVLEVGYTFPIVETATVVGFEIHVGDKVLKGKCKEKSAAKEEYQRNMVQGNSAYLMEQETDNIFKISVGKIDKDEEVTVKIKYIDKFEIVDNSIQILMPTLVTPKYRSTITNKLFYKKVDYTIDFNINIDKLINRKSIYCPSHAINLIDEENSERVEVLDYDLSKDFKLIIELKNELSSRAIISKTLDKKDMIYLSFMPEIADSYADEEKEYIFIVDVSGSMYGHKIEETKKAVIECLKQLDEGDKFNIIPFESQFEAMNMKSIDYNEENLQKAINYITNLKAIGGTEILKPLKFALFEKDANKIVLLFTDGQVGNESEIIDFVETNIKHSRVFPFGIDTNVNSSFIKQLAKVGNGKAELIQPHEKIDDKIIRTFARIQTPLLEDLTIDYGKNKLIDEIREERCLFNYEFFNVFAKVEKLEDDILLKGKIQDKEYSWKIAKEDIQKTDVDVEVLFAKQQMDRLEEYIRNTRDIEKKANYKKMIIELSEKYNINSKYTSFLTVYERDEKLLDVPIYQVTALSNAFDDGDMLAGVRYSIHYSNMVDAPDTIVCYEKAMPMSSGTPKGRIASMSPFGKSKKIFSVNSGRVMDEPKSYEERLKELVDEYYSIFISQKEKSLLTYLLYSLYYQKKGNFKFNYYEFVDYLKDYKDEIEENEYYSKIILLSNKQLNEYKQDLVTLLNDDYKKAALTDMRIKSDFRSLSQDEIKNICQASSISENIDKALEHLLSQMRW